MKNRWEEEKQVGGGRADREAGQGAIMVAQKVKSTWLVVVRVGI